MYTLDIRCCRTRARADSGRHREVPDIFPLYYRQQPQLSQSNRASLHVILEIFVHVLLLLLLL